VTCRLLPILALFTLAAAACGGSPSAVTGAATTGTADRPSTAPTASGPATVPQPPPSTDPATVPTTATAPLRGLGLEAVADGLQDPVLATAPPGDPRLFVVEKPGRIRVFGGAGGDLFLDATGVVDDGGSEQGLLGLAFHPAYAENGRLFVHYTGRGGETTLAEYRVSSDDPDRADPGSARVLLTHPQPAGNHNGGMIAFGPEGDLYLALGDGGGADDRFGNGQRTDTLLGALLRIDVDGGEPYAIPAENPFVSGGGAAEVWAYGLRNPWRFSFDDGLIYIGDVGQGAWEEIDVVPAGVPGLNFGWPITEGEVCFREANCSTVGLTPPVLTYSHDEGCSVTGGYVYRGALIPELLGHYLYGDWCGGWVRSFRYESGRAVEQADWSGDLGEIGRITSFGRDAFGEVYVVVQDGAVYRIVPVR
jgi:glucose/arabinose dehydrogenase